MVVIIMGVSGSGKTTVGKLLAQRLGWTFIDGDDYHPADNITMMSAGIPLTDADRRPWLDELSLLISGSIKKNADVILACSALTQSSRDILTGDRPDRVQFVFLNGQQTVIEKRLLTRNEHFMPPSLLESQFNTLEVPEDALFINISLSPESIVQQILSQLDFFLLPKPQCKQEK